MEMMIGVAKKYRWRKELINLTPKEHKQWWDEFYKKFPFLRSEKKQ